MVRASENLDSFVFCDPGFTFTFSVNKDLEDYIVKRLKEGNPDRLFLMPHNNKYISIGYWL